MIRRPPHVIAREITAWDPFSQQLLDLLIECKVVGLKSPIDVDRVVEGRGP